MTRSPRTMPDSPLQAGGAKCYYWVCASIMMDADDRADARVLERVYAALSCAQGEGCVRAGDCSELTLAALGRLLQHRPRG